MSRVQLVLGVVLGVGVSLVAFGLLAYWFSALLPGGNVNATRLAALLDEVERLLDVIASNETVEVYSRLLRQASSLERLAEEYARLYPKLREYNETLTELKRLIETPEYNRLVKLLDYLSSLGLPIPGFNVTRLTRLAHELRRAVALASEAVRVASRLNPRLVEESVLLLKRVGEELPPDRLARLVREARLVVGEARGWLSWYRGVGRLVLQARRASIALMTAGSFMTAFAVAYLVASRQWRR